MLVLGIGGAKASGYKPILTRVVIDIEGILSHDTTEFF